MAINSFLTIAILITLICSAILITEAIWIINKFNPKSKTNPTINKLMYIVHFTVIIGICSFIYAMFIEPYTCQINKFTIETPKLKTESFRIVQITDTHCDEKPRLENKLIKMVNQLNPDIIVFTGDSLNTNNPENQQIFINMFQQMNAPLGKYAIKGNWPHDNDQLFTKASLKHLNGETISIFRNGDLLKITGIDYAQSSVTNKINLTPENFNLLLYHSPDLIETLPSPNIDLYLAGHTHGGQVALPIYGALITFSKFGKKYESGMYKVNNTTLYVNKGIGMEGGRAPRIRFLAKPEIAVFDIKPAISKN